MSLNRSLLRFQEVPFRCYFYGERKLPGISSRLELCGLIDDRNFDEFSATRGSAAHKAIELDEKGTLDIFTVDERITPYLEAWRTFKRESGWVRTQPPEVLVAHPEMAYATAIDQCGLLPGSPRVIVMNLKTSRALYWWWSIQLAGEARAYARWFEDPVTPIRASLRLLPESSPPYRLDFHRERSDLARWDAVVTVAAMKEEHPWK